MRGAVLAVLASASLAAAAAAADRPRPIEDVEIGAAFIDACIKPAPDATAVRSAITADSRWTASTVPADFGLEPGSEAATLSAWRRDHRRARHPAGAGRGSDLEAAEEQLRLRIP